MGKKKRGTCVYCGRTRKLEDEHVFPDVIFRKVDLNPVIVPVCFPCNQEKSLGDRDLRNYLNLHVTGSNHPDARYHLERMLESNEATKNWLLRSARDANVVEFVTESGIVLGETGEFEFNRERVFAALRDMVRGLYYVETDMILGQDVPVAVKEVDWRVAPQILREFKSRDDLTFKVKGHDVAAWISMFGLPGSHPNNSAWFLVFNGSVCFFGGTGIKAIEIEKFLEHSSRQRVLRPIGPTGKEQVLVLTEPILAQKRS